MSSNFRSYALGGHMTNIIRTSSLPLCRGVVLFILCLNIAGCVRHTDAWYGRQFKSHAAESNRIVQMAHEDNQVVRVSPEFTWFENDVRWPRPISELGFTPERWNEYRQLFRLVGSDTGFSRPKIAGRRQLLLVAVETSGVAAGGSEKGFAFCDLNPTDIVHQGSDGGDVNKRSRFRFSHIEGNWYVYSRVY